MLVVDHRSKDMYDQRVHPKKVRVEGPRGEKVRKVESLLAMATGREGRMFFEFMSGEAFMASGSRSVRVAEIERDYETRSKVSSN